MNDTRISAERLLETNVFAETLPAVPGDDALSTATTVLAATDDGEVGLWEAGPGVDDDVETDEVFVVLAGRGVVTFADGSEIDLVPGVVVRLRAGDRTTWRIDERIRKFYVA